MLFTGQNRQFSDCTHHLPCQSWCLIKRKMPQQLHSLQALTANAEACTKCMKHKAVRISRPPPQIVQLISTRPIISETKPHNRPLHSHSLRLTYSVTSHHPQYTHTFQTAPKTHLASKSKGNPTGDAEKGGLARKDFGVARCNWLHLEERICKYTCFAIRYCGTAYVQAPTNTVIQKLVDKQNYASESRNGCDCLVTQSGITTTTAGEGDLECTDGPANDTEQEQLWVSCKTLMRWPRGGSIEVVMGYLLLKPLETAGEGDHEVYRWTCQQQQCTQMTRYKAQVHVIFREDKFKDSTYKGSNYKGSYTVYTNIIREELG